MSYKVPLPMADLTAIDIRDTIQIGDDNDLSHYITRARSGGEHAEGSDLDYAFKIVENGYSHLNGALIGCKSEGANGRPFFNIWSKYSPGEWFYGIEYGDSTPYLFFRLQRNCYGEMEVGNVTFGANSYCFDLGKFRGYNHESLPPKIYVPSPEEIDGESVGTVIIRPKLYLGVIDWIYAIASYKVTFDRDDFFVKIRSVASEDVDFESGYIALQGLMVGEQYVSLTIPIVSTLEVEIALFEYFGGDYQPRGILPLSDGVNNGLFYRSQTLNCLNIVYKPRIVKVVLGTQTINVEATMSYDTSLNRWKAVMNLQYTLSDFISSSDIVFSRYDNTTGEAIGGGFDSISFVDLAGATSNSKTSYVTFVFGENSAIAKSIERQNYKITIYYNL